VHHPLINKTTNVMQLGAIAFIIPWKALLLVSGALYTSHQEWLKTVHAVIGTIAYRYGVRSGRECTGVLYAPDF
jgi:hypothetical protein